MIGLTDTGLCRCPDCGSPLFYVIKVDQHGDQYYLVCVTCQVQSHIYDLKECTDGSTIGG